jgi:hypothetical protein
MDDECASRGSEAREFLTAPAGTASALTSNARDDFLDLMGRAARVYRPVTI